MPDIIDYKPPETIQQGLRQSMVEEHTAADWYRRRGMHARLKDDAVTADLYEHIAGEEDGHHQEFKERATVIMSDKEVEHWAGFGIVDLNIIMGTIFGEGAIPVHGRETRQAPCRGCRIDLNKPLEAGNCMVTTEDAIGTLSPSEVRDWCSTIAELPDGRCDRARTIKEAASACKEKYPSDTAKFFACFAPAFSRITKLGPEVTEKEARYGFLQLNEVEYEEALKSGRYPEPTQYEKLTTYYPEPHEANWKGLSLAEMFPTKYKDLLKRGVPDKLSPFEVKTVIEEKRIPYGRGVDLSIGERKESAVTSLIASLPKYQGRFFRVHIENWGIPRGTTAAGTIRFEEEELGNKYNLPPALMKELDRYRYDDVAWVGRTKDDVENYLSEGMTRKDISEMYLPAGSRIIAEDGFGGYLVLRADAIPIKGG